MMDWRGIWRGGTSSLPSISAKSAGMGSDRMLLAIASSDARWTLRWSTVWNGMTAILARVERHGNVTLGSLLKEPDFGWGPTMLACWQAVLGGRRDEALSLFGAIGV